MVSTLFDAAAAAPTQTALLSPSVALATPCDAPASPLLLLLLASTETLSAALLAAAGVSAAGVTAVAAAACPALLATSAAVI
jgi:hypothetical protein